MDFFCLWGLSIWTVLKKEGKDQIERKYGFVLAEALIAMSLILLLVSLAIHSISGIQWGPSTLDIETERIVWYIRKVEYMSIAGYPNPIGKPVSIDIEKEGIQFNNYGKSLESKMIYFETPIICMNANRHISFDINGKPYDAMTIVLVDQTTGNSNEIIIAAQTGRVRWQPLIRKG